jgi:hypothetical protein
VLPLATGSIPTSELPSSSAGGTGPAFVWIDLDAPLPVDAGERLALVLQKDSGGTTGAGQIVWAGNPGRYADGQALRYDAGGIVSAPAAPPCDPPFEPPSWKTYGSLGDFGFRTYVPEPSLPLLLAIGGPACSASGGFGLGPAVLAQPAGDRRLEGVEARHVLEHLLDDRPVAEVDRLVGEVVEGREALEDDAEIGRGTRRSGDARRALRM